ncbi:MAG: beta-eliminating lyase-related protein, partial [Saprospiraceae bacterium]
GSVLIGSREWIQKCRKIRKVMGGGMRQAGILAAAGLYALDHHLGRLQTDHDHAAQLEQCLSKLTYVDRIRKVYTNIVIFDLTNEITPENFLKQLMVFGINASAFGNQSIRFVTHLDFTKEMLFEVEDVLKNKIVY